MRAAPTQPLGKAAFCTHSYQVNYVITLQERDGSLKAPEEQARSAVFCALDRG